MSTFLDSGDILVKCENRFLIFNDKGDFIDETEFKDDPKTLMGDGVANLLIRNRLSEIKKEEKEI